MSHKAPPESMRAAVNYRAYAIGRQGPRGFDVRRVVWGRLMATYERRPGEKIRRAFVLVEKEQ